MSQRLFLKLALLALVLGLARGAAAQDRVIPLKGTTTSGTVTGMSPEKVTVDVAGTPRELAVNEINKVVYSDEPIELTRIRDQVIAGQIEQANEELKKLNADSIQRDVVKQDVEFYKAYCQGKLALQGNGNPVTADAAMMAFFRTNRGSYHAFRAAELLGQLANAQGNYAEAAKRFKFIGQAPWADYRLKANVLEARALSAAKSFPEALERYNEIIQSPETSPEVNRQKLFATVGRAVCQAETGKADEALKALETVIKDNDAKDSLLFAYTYNALGNCYLKLDKPKEARLAFLRTHLLFNGDADAHAESLSNLAKLWADAAKPDRALAAKNLLKERYPASPWSKIQ